ncbi:MAG: hypothetical protein R2712_24605 [Vicinamibacterales bacterium]
MALEDRIRTSVDQALQGLTSELLSISADEITRATAAAEARINGELEQRLSELQAREREESAAALQAAVQAEGARVTAEAETRFQAQLQDAVAAAVGTQLAEAEQRFEAQRTAAVVEAETRAADETRAAMAAAHATAREHDAAAMTRLVESIRGLDGASSLSEVLDALALAAARETSRAAVLVIKADHAVGWRLNGFGPHDTHPKAIALPVTQAGLIGRAATSARPAQAQVGDTDGPGFDPLPADRRAVAVPVLVGGRVVAVAYADGVALGPDGETAPGLWLEAVEILARHAGRCLEALTAQKAGATASAAGPRTSGTHAAAVPAAAPPDAALGATG